MDNVGYGLRTDERVMGGCSQKLDFANARFQGVLYIMAWVVCLLMGMGGLVEWEGCVQKW